MRTRIIKFHSHSYAIVFVICKINFDGKSSNYLLQKYLYGIITFTRDYLILHNILKFLSIRILIKSLVIIYIKYILSGTALEWEAYSNHNRYWPYNGVGIGIRVSIVDVDNWTPNYRHCTNVVSP